MRGIDLDRSIYPGLEIRAELGSLADRSSWLCLVRILDHFVLAPRPGRGQGERNLRSVGKGRAVSGDAFSLGGVTFHLTA